MNHLMNNPSENSQPLSKTLKMFTKKRKAGFFNQYYETPVEGTFCGTYSLSMDYLLLLSSVPLLRITNRQDSMIGCTVGF